MIFAVIQVEKSEAIQYLQLAQYCASCKRGVMPVLPVNTVLNIGILVLITITGKVPTKDVCQHLEQYWFSVGCIQNPNSGFKPT